MWDERVGDYVELEGDVVFTVETSVRTAMMAAYGLTGIFAQKADAQCAPLQRNVAFEVA